MANNRIQIKRTSVSGRAANSTTLTNPGELALNMTDGIMYSTNGSVVFEIGANNTNQRVSGTLTVNAVSANGGVGTSGQVLTSNGTSAYWATSATLNASQSVYTYTLAANTTVISGADDSTTTLSYVAGLENVFINGVRQISGVDYNTTNATAITLTANAIAGEVVQVVAWTGSINSTNVNAQFAWTNTHSFSNTVTLKAISANGSLGTAGQVLHSNGTSTYWSTDDGSVTSIATANGLSGGTITTTGTLGVTTGSTLTVNTTGIHVNTTNLSIATSQLTGDVALGTNTSGNYVATITNANGISGSSSAEGGTPTIGVVTGSTLTVNTTGIHVNSALAITSLALAGALSGVTTAAMGNTTITGFANVVSTGGVQAAAALRSGTYGAFVVPQAGQGAYNSLVANNDNLLYFSNGTINGGNLIIGTWTDRAAGYGVKFTGSTYDLSVVANTFTVAGNTTITGFINATSSGTVATTLQVGNNSGTVDATLHIKSVQGGNGRFLQFSPQGNSVNALALVASSNSSGGEQWWSFGSQNDDTFKIQKGVGFGGAGVSISNTGAITSADLADAFGYKGIPQNSQTASYTLALSDIGKHISITTGGVVIPANASVAFPIGATIVIFNNSASNQTISITSDTLRQAGTASTGSRTLAQYGLATCVKVTATVWVISGAGLS